LQKTLELRRIKNNKMDREWNNMEMIILQAGGLFLSRRSDGRYAEP
jgi:hypothetical protein